MNPLKCIRCSYPTPTDDCIFLHCQHIICYNCGQQLIEDSPHPQDYEFQCRCAQITPFDTEVVNMLKKYQPQPSYTPQSNKDIEINQVKCLYCFNCNSECFSIQEYLAGIHKDHDVKYIRKAYEQLEGNALELVDQIKELKSKLDSKEKKLKGKKKERKESVETQKVRIGMMFDKLRAALTGKEKEIYQEIDRVYERECSERVESVVGDISDRIGGLGKYQDEIYDCILSEESSYTKAFQYYNMNRERIESYMKQANAKLSVDVNLNKNTFQFDQSILTEAMTLISSIEIKETDVRRCETFRETKVIEVEQIKADDSYTQYFRKAKEQILARNSQIDSVLRRKEPLIPIVDAEKGVDIPNNIKAGLLKYSLKPKNNPKGAGMEDTQNQIKSQAKQRISRIQSMFYKSIENVETKRRNTFYD